MFKVIESPTCVRWFLVAISDLNEAENALRVTVGQDVTLENRQMPTQVFDFLNMTTDETRQWIIG
jgi:hypothetical protein